MSEKVENKEGQTEEQQPSMLKQAGKWYLTALLVFVLLAIGLVAYLVKYRPQEFFYVWF
jgi:hypothetical protein